MSKFEKVSKYAEVDINLPKRKTMASAGYDFEIAEDIIVPSYFRHIAKIEEEYPEVHGYSTDEKFPLYYLDEVAKITKKIGAKPTLVPTGVKCKLEPNTYLELTVRSSCPLKYWLVLGNGVGVIDADYYNNPDNEGEIFFQIINFSPFDILLKKGDTIGQGIIKPYLITENDVANGDRKGGFGSTDA